jgi:site-specific recombinase XerC
VELERLAHLAPQSIQTEKERLKALNRRLGSTPLMRISTDLVRDYILERKEEGVSNKTVNLELGVLRGVMKRAKRWHLFAEEIRPLPVNVGRALSYEERCGSCRSPPAGPSGRLRTGL